jgi:hypothetical protein
MSTTFFCSLHSSSQALPLLGRIPKFGHAFIVLDEDLKIFFKFVKSLLWINWIVGFFVIFFNFIVFLLLSYHCLCHWLDFLVLLGLLILVELTNELIPDFNPLWSASSGLMKGPPQWFMLFPPLQMLYILCFPTPRWHMNISSCFPTFLPYLSKPEEGP